MSLIVRGRDKIFGQFYHSFHFIMQLHILLQLGIGGLWISTQRYPWLRINKKAFLLRDWLCFVYFLKKKSYGPFLWVITFSKLQSHYEETAYLLPTFYHSFPRSSWYSVDWNILRRCNYEISLFISVYLPFLNVLCCLPLMPKHS